MISTRWSCPLFVRLLFGIIFGVVYLSGCAQLQMLPYLDQALLLKDFGREKDEQHVYVNNIDAQFDNMLAAVKSGEIQKYKTEQDIIKAFGPPILVKTVDFDGKRLKQCLYRYAIAHKGPHKIYVYYDPSGHLMRFEVI